MSSVARILLVAIAFLSSAWADQRAESRGEISLVYWGSKDCHWCTYWESSLSGMESDFRSSSLFPKITYIAVKNARVSDAYVEADFPVGTQWLWKQIREGIAHPTSLRPGWSIFVGGRHLRSYMGAKTWKDGVLPALEKVASARDESADSFARVISQFRPQAGTDKAAVGDVEAVPYVGAEGRDAYKKWLQRKVPRAFAVSLDGSWGFAKVSAEALRYCNQYAADVCELYAVDDRVVWPQRSE